MITRYDAFTGPVFVTLMLIALPVCCTAQETVVGKTGDCILYLPFDGEAGEPGQSIDVTTRGTAPFVPGLTGKAIRIRPASESQVLDYSIQPLKLEQQKDFSLQFWVRTTMDSEQKAILMSTKDYPDNGLASQKSQGRVFAVFNGTWAWNIGSGDRRISYDRTNGQFMPINDGRWHQLAMTHSASEGLIRLYFDGKNMVTYNVRDSSGFPFSNDNPLTIGWKSAQETRPAVERPVFAEGARNLQELVDEFNQLGLPEVTPDEFESLVSHPRRLFESKLARQKQQEEAKNRERLKRLEAVDLKPLETISKILMRSPYTVHQNKYYNEVALLFKLYRLQDGKVVIHEPTARQLAKREILSPPAFDLDELQICNRVLSSDEIMSGPGCRRGRQPGLSKAHGRRFRGCLPRTLP